MADGDETTVPKDPKKSEERQEAEEIFNYPGARQKSKVWDTFGFLKVKAGPPTKENLDIDHAICRLCRKSYKNKGRYTQIVVAQIQLHRLPKPCRSLANAKMT